MTRRPNVEARGDLQPIEIECFLLALFRRYGYDLRGYAPDYIRRQVLRRVREEEVESVSRLSEIALRDPEVLGRFLEQFSAPAESLFSPPAFWSSFRKNVVPFLRTYPSLRFWLVGARAEEVFSLSIVLDEDLPRNVRIYATDIHEALLSRARAGVLPSGKLAAGAKEYRRSGGKGSLKRYFDTDNGSAVLSADLRKKIVFGSHNPVTDGTFQQCHMILARNGLDLFDEELRGRLYQLMHASLVPLGFLALGSKDDLKSSSLGDRYQAVDRGTGLFQKLRD
jgi:chemotaxis protein methyltransferase CheR